MKSIKIEGIGDKEFIILVFLIMLACDVLFFKYVFPPIKHKREALLNQCQKYESEIKSKAGSIKRKKPVFVKIVRINEQIRLAEDKLMLLKNKKVSVLDVGKMIKTLFLQSGINVVSFNFSGLKRKKSRLIYNFDLVIDDSLNNIVYFLDRVENFSKNMQIPSYDLTLKKGQYEAKIKIEYVQVNMQ